MYRIGDGGAERGSEPRTMTTRTLTAADLPSIRSMYELSGLNYTLPDLGGEMIESAMVVVDDNDVPIGGVAFERILQTYLWIDDSLHPAAKLRVIRELHEKCAPVLRSKGYTQIEAFLPPQLEESFGRRLMRSFGWVRNWPSFARHF